MAQATSLLIIDDDNDLREALAEQLELSGEFSVEQVATGLDGVRKGSEGRAELILLDVDLPDINGREVCARLREAGVRAPIVMLTAADGEKETIGGLEAGATDYVTKPFRFAVLLARIRAHLRSVEQSEEAVFRIGPYQFRPAQKSLTDEKDKRIRLTDKETSILKYLLKARGEPVAREELLTEVWGYNAGVTTHTLETHIYRLRQKIEPGKGQARLLITDGGGYRLQA